MSQKGRSLLQRIKAKFRRRSKDNKQYSRDALQGNSDANDLHDTHFTNVGGKTTDNRPLTAGTDRRPNSSTPANRTDIRQNDLRIVNKSTKRGSVDESFKSVYLNDYHFADLGHDEQGTGTAAATAQPPRVTNGLHATNKERRSTGSSDHHGRHGNRRRSDTADSISIPRKPLTSSHGMAMQDGPRPDSLAIRPRGTRGSAGSENMLTPEGTEGTQRLIPTPDFGKTDFADFDLTDTVDTDQYTYQAPAVTHEVVRPHIHEITHKEIHRDIHNHEYRHYIQPVFEQEFLPARHFVPDEEGNLQEVSAKDLEGIPGCSGAHTDYSFHGKPSLDGFNHGESDRLIGQTT
ncbi:hypothetical protein BKA67DRAFT_655527 [Truncatella angustata]|uniref:Uncharacterized protein n=1 Tax=Truncatella angustata TaxID=152316 RepID=A0A9P8US10_9PEZI|nr:uncharacterized protein BKA67DRAFT_655527 [Truncatella angustata]KAH6657251.1 hypothetical protein BKA67DRAFT_655527 [Truncatella angustata]